LGLGFAVRACVRAEAQQRVCNSELCAPLKSVLTPHTYTYNLCTKTTTTTIAFVFTHTDHVAPLRAGGGWVVKHQPKPTMGGHTRTYYRCAAMWMRTWRRRRRRRPAAASRRPSGSAWRRSCRGAVGVGVGVAALKSGWRVGGWSRAVVERGGGAGGGAGGATSTRVFGGSGTVPVRGREWVCVGCKV
jgi:hypothetical protein